MSEEIINPEVKLDETVPEVEVGTQTAAPAASDVPVVTEEKTLFEIVELFKSFLEDDDRMKKAKDAEVIKSAFYKRLTRDRGGELPEENPDSSNPFAAVEDAFKSLYSRFKEEKAEWNRQQDKDREANLEAKRAVIEDLKALLDGQDDVSQSFPEFRQIQNRWREIGPVPVQNFRDLNDSYQFYVEKFYDMVKINHDLRDLDFRKNLEAKDALCGAAEKLSESENVVDAFRELQKLHEQWKELGPVAKEYREQIWDRFKAATAIVNKKYQSFFEEQKVRQGENLIAKEALCVKVEEIASREIATSNDWNTCTKEIEDIQKEWKKIGFASKKENQKIYDRFRAACDAFFEKKRIFYSQFREGMNDNYDRKLAIVEAAEALKVSTEWKKATDQIIALQKQWKEIGAVPRKKSEALWKRFRAACDEFFAERDKNAKPENDFYANFKAKKKIVEEMNAYQTGDEAADLEAAKAFAARWQAIGFVPFKEKEGLNSAYREALSRFPRISASASSKGGRSEKDTLIQKFNALKQDIVTYENNIGFFSASKNAAPLLEQMREKIEAAKSELEELKKKIRKFEEEEQD